MLTIQIYKQKQLKCKLILTYPIRANICTVTSICGYVVFASFKLSVHIGYVIDTKGTYDKFQCKYEIETTREKVESRTKIPNVDKRRQKRK
jgi:hypothetical protein